MNYFLGGGQPVDPVGYWLKGHSNADVACLVIQNGTERLRTACGEYLPKKSATQGVRGVRLCESCVARARAKMAKRKVKDGSKKPNLGTKNG